MKKTFLSLALSAFIFAFVFGLKPANATVMLKQSVADLTGNADNIVVGKVIKIKSEWNLKRTKIFTYTTIEVTTEVKGVNETKTVVIREIGGEVDGRRLFVAGSAQYSEGEEVVLFLNKLENSYRTVGMTQGKYNVITDKITGKKSVINRAAGGVTLLDKNTREAVEPDGDIEMELEEFIGIIKLNISE